MGDVRDGKPKHRRPTPEQLDERVSLEHDDPEAVIEALLGVDPDGPEDERPKGQK